MSGRYKRLLPTSLLPETLFDKSAGTLRLPPVLAQAYVELIDRHGLRDLASSRDPNDPPVGGLDQERTDQHFAQAFDGSVARAQLAVIDPKKEVTRASNAFVYSLSGNALCITDAPCGAGAAVFSFLATTAELRAQDVLPRQPLYVHLIGGEISNPARAYAVEILREIRPFLKSQAIYVEEEFIEWDVTDKLSNTDLIQKMTLASGHSRKRLLLVANFSGFLEKKRKRKTAEPQLEELFRHTSGAGSVAIWIEPKLNAALAQGGLFAGVTKWVTEKWHWFSKVNVEGGTSDPVLTSVCSFESLLEEGKAHPVRLAVMRLDLDRST